jgi:hypothetical protein
MLPNMTCITSQLQCNDPFYDNMNVGILHLQISITTLYKMAIKKSIEHNIYVHN